MLISILEGQTAIKQIAHDLTISQRTGEVYRRNIRAAIQGGQSKIKLNANFTMHSAYWRTRR